MYTPEQEKQARDEILAAVTRDPQLFAEMYSRMDDIESLAISKGMSTIGANVLYVRWLRRIVGPMPRITAEWFDAALDYLTPDVYDKLACTLRRELRTDRKHYDIVHRVIFQRGGAGLPDWLMAIWQDMSRGALPRPKPRRGRPAGAGRIEHPAAQQNIATLVYILSERTSRDDIALYNDTNASAVTICSIIAQALTEEGLHRTAAEVRDAWLAHKDSHLPS